MISIIITSLNEKAIYLRKTIDSLLSTLNTDDEIIIVDDHSELPILINYNKNKVKIHRNFFRMGVAQSRHVGATLAKNKWLLFTDSHMIFDKDWRINFEEHQKTSTTKTLYNGTCLGLWEGEFKYENLDLNKLPHYYGARLSLWEEKEKKILEGKWIEENKNEDNYKISCLMGAIYFIQKDYFFNLRGLSDLKMWGSDEPCLAIKTLLTGGEIRQLKNVKAAHVFRLNAPYKTENKYLTYNKIRMAKTLLPDELYNKLINKLNNNSIFNEALNLVERESKTITEYKNYYKSIFTEDFYKICDKFKINYESIS